MAQEEEVLGKAYDSRLMARLLKHLAVSLPLASLRSRWPRLF